MDGLSFAILLFFGGLFVISCSIALILPLCLLRGESRKAKSTTFVILAWISGVVAMITDILGIKADGARIEDLLPLVVSQFLLPYAIIAMIYSVSDAEGKELDKKGHFKVISSVILILYAIIRVIFIFINKQ